MIDTNQINQVAQDAAAIHAQLSANWPAICGVAVIVARELRNFNLWVVGVAEFVIRHGGIAWLFWKLVWNPPLKTQFLKPGEQIFQTTPVVLPNEKEFPKL